MEYMLGTITHNAVNYAIRSGIAVTCTYSLNQCSKLLKTVDNRVDFQELRKLQDRLDSKIKVRLIFDPKTNEIVAPAIDLIELIAARGNTSLETAVTLTKALRWDIQSLGIQITKILTAEVSSEGNESKDTRKKLRQAEIKVVINEVRDLIRRIEDAVPLINLAITTSGAKLSNTLPETISPSRLLQGSTCVTACDVQFSRNPNIPVQVGPTLNLSMYMLFAGHRRDIPSMERQKQNLQQDEDGLRNTTWKEVIHKASVKLMRVPLRTENAGGMLEFTPDYTQSTLMSADGKANEFAYQLEIIEDLDDDRVHTFDDNGPQPGPYKDIQLAGIREAIPIYQVGKIFYADTGKILNIGTENETNSPVLLLKRDINALPPRKMMEVAGQEEEWDQEQDLPANSDEDHDSQLFIDAQLERESSEHPSPDTARPDSPISNWRLPSDLDPEWVAFEVYTEADTDDDSSDETFNNNVNDDSAYESRRTSASRGPSTTDSGLLSSLANMRLGSESPATAAVADTPHDHDLHSAQTSSPAAAAATTAPPTPQLPPPPGPAVRSSLSLLEVLIRLTSLQQFQQASHLSVHDELLSFFLDDASTTTGAGTGDERHRRRWEARQKVGFDPYTDSPVKPQPQQQQQQQQQAQQHGAVDNHDDVVAAHGVEAEDEEDRYYYNYYHDHDPAGAGAGAGARALGGSSAGYPTGRPRDRDRDRARSSASPAWSPSPPPPPSQQQQQQQPPLYRQQRKNVSYQPVSRVRRQGSEGTKSASPLSRSVRPGAADSSLGTSPGLPEVE